MAWIIYSNRFLRATIGPNLQWYHLLHCAIFHDRHGICQCSLHPQQEKNINGRRWNHIRKSWWDCDWFCNLFVYDRSWRIWNFKLYRIRLIVSVDSVLDCYFHDPNYIPQHAHCSYGQHIRDGPGEWRHISNAVENQSTKWLQVSKQGIWIGQSFPIYLYCQTLCGW